MLNPFIFHKKTKNSNWLVFAFSENYFMGCFAEIHQQEILIKKLTCVSLTDNNWQKVFLTFIEKENQKNLSIMWVLQPHQYQLLPVDPLPVPDTELAQAALWRAREILEVPVHDIAVDAFMVPPHGPGQQRRLTTLVVSQKKWLTHVADFLMTKDLDITIIDICDLVLRRVAYTFKSDITSQIYLAIHPFACQLIFTEADHLLFSRTLEIDATQLTDKRSFESLLLQIQRTLDYYSSHYAKTLPPYLCMSAFENNEPLLQALKENLNFSIEIMDWRTLLPLADIPISLQQNTSVLLAALLRLRE